MTSINKIINGPVIVAPIIIGAFLSGLIYLAEGSVIPLTIFQLTLVCGFLLFFLKKIVTQDLKIETYGLEKEFLLFLSIIFFSIIYTPERTQALLSAIRFIVLIIMTYLIFNSINTKKEFQQICNIFIAIALVLGIQNIFEVYFNPEIAAFNYVNEGEKLVRSSGTESDPNIYASHYFVPLMLLIAHIGEAKTNKTKILIFGLAGLLIVPVLLTYSRSAWVSIFLGGMLIMAYQKRFDFLLYSAIALIAVVFVSESLQNLLISILTRFQDIFAGVEDDSSRFRLFLGKASILMCLDSYLMGIGFQGFSTEFQKYYPVQETAGIYEPHNDYLMVLAELGLFGFIIFLVILLKVLKVGWEGLKYFKDDKRMETLQLGLLASFISYLVFHQFYAGMLYSGFFFINFILIFLWKKLVIIDR